MNRNELVSRLDELLSASKFKDYCPNGLQVEGPTEVSRIVTGVTASAELIERAIEMKADALLVHHGYFWKGEPEPITGIKANRIKALIKSDINLIAYHLPLDAHPELGNNAQLASLLGIEQQGVLGDPDTSVLAWGQFNKPVSGAALASCLKEKLNRKPLHSSVVDEISKVAWCTGGGQDFIEQAAEAGCDAFISGEVSERTILLSRELGIDYFAAGHHATERYGIKALGEYIAGNFGIEVNFVDIDNPA
ncbi:Nif3-like dinuclear metal center hexameric protein [Corallincola platygyrae]|uniref:Nif3-like dinuclear metal center hexameric protein n=1 Tax=Corallincola platygyrae TaxID=1193278 RepID=A0ABW4XN73_9GAMM